MGKSGAFYHPACFSQLTYLVTHYLHEKAARGSRIFSRNIDTLIITLIAAVIGAIAKSLFDKLF